MTSPSFSRWFLPGRLKPRFAQSLRSVQLSVTAYLSADHIATLYAQSPTVVGTCSRYYYSIHPTSSCNPTPSSTTCPQDHPGPKCSVDQGTLCSHGHKLYNIILEPSEYAYFESCDQQNPPAVQCSQLSSGHPFASGTPKFPDDIPLILYEAFLWNA
ncbi:hypothetical protein VTN31DRAFT_6406 [Thermomyces dupontii]|uniref:uncharacterized protein n=1 Tax=Talaromyces thermophilus TaxID=28565 RepID=UPI003742A85A